MRKQKTAISLFAGCGGDTLGLEQAGFKVIGFVEFLKSAVETHELNFPESKLIGKKYDGDITKIPDEVFEKFKGKINILFAGFPCQGFSHAGKKDPNDTRNKLFWEFQRIAKIIQPDWIIGENVAGLIRRKTDDGENMVKDIIVNAFEDIGYKMARPTILKAENFGVPQKRRRVFFVGSLNHKFNFEFPKETHSITNLPSIENIIEFDMENTIKVDLKDFEVVVENMIENLENEEDADNKAHPFLKKKVKDKEISFGRRISPTHVEIVNLKKPTKTIHCGYSFQPRLFVAQKTKKGIFLRTLNIKELGQIQGFPKDFKFIGKNNDQKIVQIGNAVPPMLAKIIAEKILEIDKSL